MLNYIAQIVKQARNVKHVLVYLQLCLLSIATSQSQAWIKEEGYASG